MSDPSKRTAKVPPGQRAIRAMCFYPTGTFVEFKKEEVERIAVQICENGAHLIAAMLTVLRDAQAQLVITDSENASHSLTPTSVRGRCLAVSRQKN